jgi:hypothetical protein
MAANHEYLDSVASAADNVHTKRCCPLFAVLLLAKVLNYGIC